MRFITSEWSIGLWAFSKCATLHWYYWYYTQYENDHWQNKIRQFGLPFLCCLAIFRRVHFVIIPNSFIQWRSVRNAVIAVIYHAYDFKNRTSVRQYWGRRCISQSFTTFRKCCKHFVTKANRSLTYDGLYVDFTQKCYEVISFVMFVESFYDTFIAVVDLS